MPIKHDTPRHTWGRAKIGLCAAMITCWAGGWCPPAARAERPHTVALVDCRAFSGDGDPETMHARHALPLFQFLTGLGLSPAWVPVEIFLPAMKADRNRFQRIVIPWNGAVFSPEMFAGMTDYVQNGGLLISNSLMHYLDTNRNFKLDDADKYFGLKTKRQPRSMGRIFDTLGVYGHRNPSLTALRAEVKCPLTQHLPIGKNLPLVPKAVIGREIQNHSAMVIISADRQKQDGTIASQPAVTIKNDGRGTCVYIVPRFTTNDQTIVTVFKNAFSPATLDWLTAD